MCLADIVKRRILDSSSSRRLHFLDTICSNSCLTRNTNMLLTSRGSTAPRAQGGAGHRSVDPGRQPGWWTPSGTRIYWAPRSTSLLSLFHKSIWPEMHIKTCCMCLVGRKKPKRERKTGELSVQADRGGPAGALPASHSMFILHHRVDVVCRTSPFTPCSAGQNQKIE